MKEGENREEDKPEHEADGFAVRNVTEFLYAGCPAVIVRTTHLQGSEEESEAPQGVQHGSGRS